MKKKFKPFTERLKKVDQFIREYLRKLPGGILYHSIEHTLHPINGVVAVCNKLAIMERVSYLDRELVIVAAYFHDIGFVDALKERHEERAVEVAKLKLPQFGFNKDEIDIICKIIMSTKIGIKPKTTCEEIINDADVDNLGRDDFFERAELLRREFGIDEDIWHEKNIKFLKNHKWLTKSQQKLREKKKKENLKRLVEQ